MIINPPWISVSSTRRTASITAAMTVAGAASLGYRTTPIPQDISGLETDGSQRASKRTRKVLVDKKLKHNLSGRSNLFAC